MRVDCMGTLLALRHNVYSTAYHDISASMISICSLYTICIEDCDYRFRLGVHSCTVTGEATRTLFAWYYDTFYKLTGTDSGLELVATWSLCA
jgi:hypothetical protein